jgi:hypothetical protein
VSFGAEATRGARGSSSGMRSVCQKMVAQPLAGGPAGTIECLQRVERRHSDPISARAK